MTLDTVVTDLYIVPMTYISRSGDTTYTVTAITRSGIFMEVRCQEFGWNVTNPNARFTNKQIAEQLESGNWTERDTGAYVWPTEDGFAVRDETMRALCICEDAEDAAKISFALNHTRGM